MRLFWRVFLAATVSFTVILGAAAVLLTGWEILAFADSNCGLT